VSSTTSLVDNSRSKGFAAVSDSWEAWFACSHLGKTWTNKSCVSVGIRVGVVHFPIFRVHYQCALRSTVSTFIRATFYL